MSIITQSAPDTGRKGVGLGTVEGAQRGWAVQLINNSHAAARGPRAEGGIILQLEILASGFFEEKATKQRARRRRAAYTLTDNNTLETDPINRDTDGDGERGCCPTPSRDRLDH